MRRARILQAALPLAALIALGGCRRDTQDVRGGDEGDVAIPQQTGATRVTDTTGLPVAGALPHIAIGDLAGVGNNSLDATVANPYENDMAAIKAEKAFAGWNCGVVVRSDPYPDAVTDRRPGYSATDCVADRPPNRS